MPRLTWKHFQVGILLIAVIVFLSPPVDSKANAKVAAKGIVAKHAAKKIAPLVGPGAKIAPLVVAGAKKALFNHRSFLSSLDDTLSILEGPVPEMEEGEDDADAIADAEDDDADEEEEEVEGVEPRMAPGILLPGRLGIGVGKRVSAFFDHLDDTLNFIGDIEDIEDLAEEIEELADEDEDLEDEDEDLEDEDEGDEDTAEVVEDDDEAVPTPVISVIASKVFGDRSDHVPEPEEMLSSLARDEPEEIDEDEVMEMMIETNEIPDFEALQVGQDTPMVVEGEEDEGADDIFIDDAGDEIDEDGEDVTVEVEQEEDVAGEEMTEGGEDDEEATVEVEQDADDVFAEDNEDGEEDREGIFRRIFNLFKE